LSLAVIELQFLGWASHNLVTVPAELDWEFKNYIQRIYVPCQLWWRKNNRPWNTWSYDWHL